MSNFRQRFEFPSRREAIEATERAVVEALEQAGYEAASVFAIRLALEEALTNAVRHGNDNNPERQVVLAVEIDPAEARFDVKDEGVGFDPQSVPDPTAQENLDIPSGRGLMLMRSFMAEVIVHPPGNRVSMRYTRHRN